MRPPPTETELAALHAAEDRDTQVSGEARKRRGIVHTPIELARALVALLDERLRAAGLEHGAHDPRVTLVDPACGAGAFLAAALAVSEGSDAAPAAVVGVDIDPDAIRRAEQTLRPAMQQKGWSLRLSIDDALETDPTAAAKEDVVVVLGNPPWAGRSANRGATLMETLLEDFRRDAAGERLNERKIGVLSDDYVRFVRWGAERVRRAPGGGAIAMVTNNSYLDGAVHRGMRAALLRWFDDISVVDLGGNALVAGGAESDENVFGVRPGVGLLVATRTPESQGKTKAKSKSRSCRYVRVTGRLADKWRALGEPLPWQAWQPDDAGSDVLRPAQGPRFPGTWIPLDTLIPFHREGVQTNRDEALVADDVDTLVERMERYAGDGQEPDLGKLRVETRHFDPDKARRKMRAALAANEPLTSPLAYRPFQPQHFVHVTPACHRPRPLLRAAMAHSHLALITVRKDRGRADWHHFAVVREVPDNCYLSSRSSCRARAFPTHDPDGQVNLDPEALAALTAGLEVPPGDIDPDRVFAFCAGVLSAAAYRRRFDGALRTDYPRIPIPTRDAFDALADAGEALIALFLHRPDPPELTERTQLGHRKEVPAPLGFKAASDEANRRYLAHFPGPEPPSTAEA